MTTPAGGVWLADAAVALSRLEVSGESTTAAVFGMLGMSLAPRPSASRADLTPPRSGVDETPHLEPPPLARTAVANVTDTPVVPLGAVCEIPPDPPDSDTPNPWAHVRPLTRSRTEAGPMPLTSLFQLPSARPILSAALSTTRPGRRVDWPRALAVLARGHLLREVPFVPVPTLRSGVQILVDRGRALEPFRRDCHDLIDTVRSVVGRSAVSERHYVDTPEGYQPPDRGTPVLALTDFGRSGHGDADAVAWNRIAAALSHRGSTLVMLTPHRARPPELAPTVAMVQWDSRTSVRTVLEARAGRRLPTALGIAAKSVVLQTRGADGLVATLAARDPELVRLAELLAPAVTVSPELLRRMRIRLAPGLDVWAESELWFSPLVRAAGRNGFSFSVAVVGELLTRLRHRWEDPAQREVVEKARILMTELHAGLSPPLRLEETVAWSTVTGEGAHIENALASAVVALVTGSDLSFWARQAAPRLPDDALRSTSGWLLSQLGGREDPGVGTDMLALPIDAVMRSLPTVPLLVRHSGTAVEMGSVRASDAVLIRVPQTNPPLLEVGWPGGVARVSVPAGERIDVDVGAGPVSLRDAAGRKYRADSRSGGDPAESCVWIPDLGQTGFFVGPDLVVTAAKGISSFVLHGGERIPVSAVVHTAEVLVLRLARPRLHAPVLNVGPDDAPLVPHDRWRGALARSSGPPQQLGGGFENTSDTTRFTVWLDRREDTDELTGCPVVVDRRLVGMILGYQSSYAVGLSVLAAALGQVPARPHALIIGEPPGELGDLIGGTLWICEFDGDGRLRLSRRIRYVAGRPDGPPSGDVDHLPAVDITDLIPDRNALSRGQLIALAGDTVDRLEEVIGRAHAGAAEPRSEHPLLASAGNDGTVRVWDARAGGPTASPLTGHTGPVNSVAFSPDGTHLASGGQDGQVRMWDAFGGQLTGRPLTGHTGGVWDVAFSPDGARIASCGDDQTVRIWDADTGQPIGAPLVGHTGPVSGVAFAPDGVLIASGADDQTVRIWDADTGIPVGTPLTGHTAMVTSVAFTPDGAQLASGSNDGTVRVWNVSTGQPVGRPLTGHTGGVWDVAVTPDGTRIASAGSDGTVRLWNVSTGQPVGTPLTGHTDEVLSVAFSPASAPVRETTRSRAPADADAAAHLADLLQSIALDFHVGLPGLRDAVDRSYLERIVDDALGTEVFELVRKYSEWGFAECAGAVIDLPVRQDPPDNWKRAAVGLGLPTDVTYVAALRAGLRAVADTLVSGTRTIRYAAFPPDNDVALQSLGMSVDRLTPHQATLESTAPVFRKTIDWLFDVLERSDAAALGTVGAVTQPDTLVGSELSGAAALAGELVSAILWPTGPRPRLAPTHLLAWREFRDQLTAAGTPGFSDRLDIFEFLDHWQRLIADGLDTVARTVACDYEMRYGVLPSTAQWVSGSPFQIRARESDYGVLLRMPFAHLAGLFSWAAPQLVASLRAAANRRAAAEGSRAGRVIAFSGPVDHSEPRAVDIDELRRRIDQHLHRRAVGRGDELIIADVGDLPAADVALQRGATVRILLDTVPDPTADDWLAPGRVAAILDQAAVSVASQIWPSESPRSLAGRGDRWMLTVAEAIGGSAAAVLVVTDPRTNQPARRSTEVIMRAQERGIREIDVWPDSAGSASR